MKYNLIVSGGGLTGVAAAVSAAREGLKVLLIERSGSLGGAINNNLVYPFMVYWTDMPEDNSKKYLSAGLFAEMRDREKKYDNTDMGREINFQPEYMKLVLDDMVSEAGVDVLFHSTVYDVETEGRFLKNVSVATAAGSMTIEGDFFVDATGNGDVMAYAGCDFQIGRDSDGLCQPMTTCFRMSNVDIDLFNKDREMLDEAFKQAQIDGKISFPRELILVFTGLGEGIMHFNTTRVIKMNATNAFEISKAEMICRRQVNELVTFLKENSKAFANASLIAIANEIGVRESRKLRGEHILTVEELKDLVDFEDSIALGNYDIDIHNPSGNGTSHYYFEDGVYYKIPYRSLLPKEFDNLLVAGRCLSATHEAQASVRIMPICACMGDAAGTAIAVAYNSGTNTHTVDIKEVQNKLAEHGAAF